MSGYFCALAHRKPTGELVVGCRPTVVDRPRLALERASVEYLKNRRVVEQASDQLPLRMLI
jgi:hypothetical protein